MASKRTIEEIQKVSNVVIKKLRQKKFANGQSFMINSRSLPKGTSYLEYSNGQIIYVKLTANHMDFEVIEELTPVQSQKIRRELHLIWE